ncbi:MAG: tRNA glutamyl-Q(34) synthetase GluQRS, partial [Prochlorococcaceae cyanobacterium ETNP18_MAG_1]|nr:tRNA glutamyl-Q(34) synthetase GluQRS [Prochlorococcaceae cyanobacterium ETNP18_MAG_1]
MSVLPGHLDEQLEHGRLLRLQGYRGRFAPSPTGAMHLGNLRTALVSWLRARLANGIWLLRVDDLDKPRNREGSVESVQQDLRWLGLDWDGVMVLQSQRRWIYTAVLSFLKRQRKLYACRCSRRMLAELAVSDEHRLLYPGTCRDLSLSWGWHEGRLPSWRLRVNQQFSNSSGDVVLRRADGFIAYHLATAVDELTLGITEVVRGRDLADAMPAQLAVIEAMEQEPMAYRHVPLLCDEQGRKLAKRDGGAGLKSLRAQGMGPEEIVGQLAA